MTNQPDTWGSGARHAALLEPDDHTHAERGFPWGPWATFAWLIVTGAVTLVVIMLAGVAITGWQYAQLDSTFAAKVPFLEFFLSGVSRLFLPLTMVQTLAVVAMVVLLTRRGRTGRTRRQMLALEAMPVWPCIKWTAATLVVVMAFSELPRLVFDLGHEDALEWLKLMQPAWLAMILLVVLAPLSEELLFRGFAYAGLAPSRIGPVGAIVLTSAVWAVIHVQYAWPLIAQIFIFGVVFGIVRWRSGSLWPPIIAHGIVNLFAGLSTYGPEWGLI